MSWKAPPAVPPESSDRSFLMRSSLTIWGDRWLLLLFIILPKSEPNINNYVQLWFGAECLAAGSSIMNKVEITCIYTLLLSLPLALLLHLQEFESEQMRPLAKAVTKTLEKVRGYLREQVDSEQEG